MAGEQWMGGGQRPIGTPLEDVVTPPSDVFPPGIQGNDPSQPPAPPSGEPVPQLSGPELDVDQPAGNTAVPGTLDAMPQAQTPMVRPHELTSQQKLKIKRLQAEHQMNYERTLLNPAEEAKFQREFKNSEWAKGFQAQFGTLPDPNDPSYDYRGAWKQGQIPARAGMHWPDRGPNGQWLKSPDHPTAWMEYYQDATGHDPDEDGVDTKRYNQMLYGQVAQSQGQPGGGVGAGGVGGTQAPARPEYARMEQAAAAHGMPKDTFRGFFEKAAADRGQTVDEYLAEVFPSKAGDKQTAFLGMGGAEKSSGPKMRDGQPVGPDGYTQAEREYMKGAGVDPSQKQPAAPPAGSPATQPPPPTKREGDLNKMIEDAEKGKGKGTLGEQWKKRGARRRRIDDEIVETS